MRVLMLPFLVAALLVGQAGPTGAHFPSDLSYPVFQFPDGLEPSIDGELSDWTIVPERYWTGTAELMETVRGLGEQFDEQDLAVRTAVGWSDTQNRLYFAVAAYDDIHNVDRGTPPDGIWGGDIWEIVVDADHSGGIYNGFSNQQLEDRWRSAQAQNYHVFLPPEQPDWTMWLWGKGQWVCRLPYAQVGWQYDGVPGGKGTVFQEVSLTPFDDLNWAGPDSSVVHELREGEILGISWSFLDFDASDKDYDGFWNLSHATRMDHTADLFPDFVLQPIEPTVTVVAGSATASPARSGMAPSYPNPFNSQTTIRYELGTAGRVRLAVYTATGQHLRTLVDQVLPAGAYSVTWDGKDESGRVAASGVYLCRIQTGAFSEVRKMVSVR